jgi:type I restriction enzyme, S subunit
MSSQISTRKLPKSWNWVTLSEISKLFDCKHYTPTYVVKGIPLIRTNDIKPGLFEFGSTVYISREDYEELTALNKPQAQDIVFAREGSFGVASYIKENREYAIGQRTMVIRADRTKVDPIYLTTFINSPDCQEYLLKFSMGTTVKRVNVADVKELPVIIPPLEEQKRIASIAQKCDRLRRTRRYTQQLSDGYLRSVFLEMFGKCLADYPSTPLGEIVTITGGGTPSRDVPAYFEGNIPWLTSKDMKGNYIFDTQEHITEEAIKKSATKLVPKNSILLVVKSKVLMHRLPLAITRVELCHGQDIKSIQCSKKVNPYFLVYVLKHNEKQLLIRARGANTEGLTLPMLEAIPVPDVDISVQEKFAQVVQRFERLCTQQREADRQTEHLFQTVLDRAFRGEL